MRKRRKNIRHNLLLAGLENSNHEIMEEKPIHPFVKFFRNLIAFLFIIAITYIILNR